ncbi:MAG: hypothetical protein B7X93_09000 [Hydrogenophilales bacterium 17-61-9]|nr:MAG: hypothetical protein B7X93_09000 [Hydrogenophilales bacterium 17-61-9]
MISETPESSQEPQPKPKKLDLNALLPAKIPVETSLGTLYVRHAYTTDWKHFESDDAQELGRVVVRQLSSRVEQKNDSEPLAEEDLEALNEADFLALVPVISKHCGWGEMPAGAGIRELGDVAKVVKEQEVKLHEKMLTDMRKSLDSSYRFLGKGALDKLQEQMAGLADIRNAMSGTEAMRAAMLASGQPGDAWKNGLAGKSVFEKAMHGVAHGDIMKGIVSPQTSEPFKIQMPFRPEDTPLGRATLESAENAREVAQKMAALVEVVAGLNQTLVKDVLPAWFKQVEDDQRSAKDAFSQAANGLWWTKWAVIASVVVTVLTTWWQVSVARDIDRENTEQQNRTETVLREHLAAQQKLIEQQARDAATMRATIAALKPPATVAAPKR